MIAVILAAGLGVRLRPITYSIPKGLIRVGGKPLLRRSLANISRQGIEEAIIVVGYKGKLIRQELGNTCEGVSINFVENSEYLTTGSMYSLCKAETQISGDILLLESDLFYEQRAVEVTKQRRERDLILVAAARGSGDEVYIRADNEGRLVDLGKAVVLKGEAIGELVGISKLSSDFLKYMFTQAQSEIVKDGEISYEEVISATARHYDYPIFCMYIKDLIWTEVDTTRDLDEANRLAGVIQSKGLESS